MQNINFEDMPLPLVFKFKTDMNDDYVAKFNGEKYEVTWPGCKKPDTYFPSKVRCILEDGDWKIIEEVKDEINKPDHYHHGGIDVIGFSEAQFSKDELRGFYRINCLKYITRFDRKNGAEDLKKGLFYLNKLLEMEEAK